MSDKRRFILAHDQARAGAAAFIRTAPVGYVVTVAPPKRNSDINAALHATLGEIAATYDKDVTEQEIEETLVDVVHKL